MSLGHSQYTCLLWLPIFVYISYANFLEGNLATADMQISCGPDLNLNRETLPLPKAFTIHEIVGLETF